MNIITNVPENYYGIANDDTSVEFTEIITCMGICITTHSNIKAFVHLSDLAGFPTKETYTDKHPLPNNLHANSSKAWLIFKFLFEQISIKSPDDIKNITIFGNYKNRYDVFPYIEDGIDKYSLREQLSDFLNLPLDTIFIKPMMHTAVRINEAGLVSIIPKEYDELFNIESANIEYHHENKDIPLIFKNKVESNISKDDTSVKLSF
ncbi:hypothetical protein L3V82_11600 [Thiotrichales bacterium 19S3-7]|nr:hypothetical protein [Thiotrichales bacterium 19S3-7]MCF6802858.1 hypothetical protein [Thiotrichales bacterium 19S3-11]